MEQREQEAASEREYARVHSYERLPEHVKLFFEGLRPEDVDSIKEGIVLAKAAKTVGRFWKWTAITVVAVFGGMATLGQSLKWLWHQVTGEG